MGYYRSNRSYQSPGTRIVLALILANVAVFIATAIASRSANLSWSVAIQFGISRVTIGEYPWTVLTSLFLHDGIMHILFNMLWLYWYGSILVQLISEVKFILLYFIGGLVGNALFILIEPNSLAVGASGAIFALGGALAVMRPRIKIVLFPIPIPMDLWVYVIVGFALMSFLPGIGWQAHLGGLVTGLSFGWYFRSWERRRGIYR